MPNCVRPWPVSNKRKLSCSLFYGLNAFSPFSFSAAPASETPSSEPAKEAAPKKETSPLPKAASEAPPKKKLEVDHGMSKKEDKDLYSTRGN